MVTVVQGKVCAKNHPDRLSRLATIHQRYRRTDRRTDFVWHRPRPNGRPKNRLIYSGNFSSKQRHQFHQHIPLSVSVLRVILRCARSTTSWARTWLESHRYLPITFTKGDSWALLRKSAVESTALAHPFCVNQAVWDTPQRLHAQLIVVR